MTAVSIRAVVLALVLAGTPMVAHAQVFLASEPNPQFTIGPLLIVGTVQPDLGPVSVRVSWSVMLPPSAPSSHIGEALYLRAHKQEKFLLNSVIGALAVAPSTYFLGRYYGAAGMVAGNLAIAVLLGLPMGTWVFVKYRRLWHEERQDALEIGVFDRMIFGLNRVSFLFRIERRTLRHRPRNQHAVVLEPEVVVHPRRCVFLHHEPPGAGRALLPEGLGRSARLSLGPILM